MQQNNKLPRLNGIDYLLILFVLLVGVSATLYLSNKKTNPMACNVSFTVELKDMDEGFAERIHVGDPIKDSIKGYYLGVVDQVSKEPMTMIVFDEQTLLYKEVTVPHKYTVLVKILGNGVETEQGLFSEGQPIKIGKELSIKGKGYAQTGYVIELYATKVGA